MLSSQISSTAAFDLLKAELDAWERLRLKASFWWRDDDAATATPQLAQMLAVARKSRIKVALAVIPAKADASLVEALRGQPCCVWQHGWSHEWHSYGEFGEGRPLELLISEALQGQLALDKLFGSSGWQRAFVPPHHSLALSFKSLLPILGFQGVSLGELGDGYRPTPVIATVPETNADVDVVDWANSQFKGPGAVCHGLVSQLEKRRIGLIPATSPIGLLTHHLIHANDVWQFLSGLFDVLSSHPAAELIAPDTLFRPQGALLVPKETSCVQAYGQDGSTNEVTVIITSCGRYDLLERTLDSFFRFNAHPIRKVIVIEDGPAPDIEHLKQRYHHQPMIWADTGERVGQIRAIDMAYRLIDTEYYFHCEEDWEFYRPGFIENSMKVLKAYPEVLQVWIRSFPDLDPYPRIEHLFHAEDVPFYLVADGVDATRQWVWYGFTFNPGLHRTSDYRLIGSYSSLDGLNEKLAVEIEQALGIHYRGMGFHAGMIADQNGAGYVKHIGEGRHVTEPVQHLYAPVTFRQHLKDLLPSLVRALRWRLQGRKK